MRNGTGWILAAALLAVAAPSLCAQRLIPRVGLYVPVTDLGSATADGFDGAVTLGKKESTRAYGLGVEFGSGSSIGLRGDLAFATASDVPISGVGCAQCSSRTTMLAATGGVVLRPFRLFFVEPYFVGGVGLKRYGFSRADLDDGFDSVVDDRNVRTYQLGVGGELSVGPLHGLFEVSDFVSRDDPLGGVNSDRQHDFIVSIGLAIGG